MRVFVLVFLALLDAFSAWAAKPLPGVCYSPFRTGQSPLLGRYPTQTHIKEDLQFARRAAGAIRLYGNERTLRTIPALCAEIGLPCYPAVFLTGDAAVDDPLVAALIQTAQKSFPTTRALIVGNETLLFNRLSKKELKTRLRQVRRSVSVPVTTAEPWHIWRDHPDLVPEVDFICLHVHPYWEVPPQSIENAAAFVVARFQEIQTLYPSVPVVIGETGWPSKGPPNENAVPSPTNQKRFFLELDGLAKSAGILWFGFELFDESWKEEGGVGAHWGLCETNRPPKPKPALKGLIQTRIQPKENSVTPADIPLRFWWWAPPPTDRTQLRIERWNANRQTWKLHLLQEVRVIQEGKWRAFPALLPAGHYRWTAQNGTAEGWNSSSPWIPFYRILQQQNVSDPLLEPLAPTVPVALPP